MSLRYEGITTKDGRSVPELLRDLTFDAVPDQEEVEAAMLVGAELLERAIYYRAPRHTDELADSITVGTVMVKGTGPQGRDARGRFAAKPEEAELLIEVAAQHAIYMEQGTGPHKAEKKAAFWYRILGEWIRDKMAPESDSHVWALATVIGRKIEADGLKARRFVAQAFEDEGDAVATAIILDLADRVIGRWGR